MFNNVFKRVASIAIIAIATFYLLSCSGFSEFKAHNNFVSDVLLKDKTLSRSHLVSNDFSLHYVASGAPEQAVVLWLHGTPGLWTEAGKLMVNNSFLKKVKLISIDRPGWGESKPLDKSISNKKFTQFSEQSRLIGPLIITLKEQYPELPLYIAGHSWGASLAPYLAANHNELIEGLILFAGTLSPELTKPRWYNYFARVWPFSLIGGNSIQLANAEMFSLSEGITALSQRWSDLQNMPILVVQGGEDFLVKVENTDYASKVLASSNSLIVIDQDYGHLWHVQRSEIVADCILAMVNKNLSECALAVNGKE